METHTWNVACRAHIASPTHTLFHYNHISNCGQEKIWKSEINVNMECTLPSKYRESIYGWPTSPNHQPTSASSMACARGKRMHKYATCMHTDIDTDIDIDSDTNKDTETDTDIDIDIDIDIDTDTDIDKCAHTPTHIQIKRQCHVMLPNSASRMACARGKRMHTCTHARTQTQTLTLTQTQTRTRTRTRTLPHTLTK